MTFTIVNAKKVRKRGNGFVTFKKQAKYKWATLTTFCAALNLES